MFIKLDDMTSGDNTIRRQLMKKRPKTILSQEEYSINVGRYVKCKPPTPPVVKASISLDIEAYVNREPQLQARMRQHLTQRHGTWVKKILHLDPHDIKWTADSGAQVTVLGENTLNILALTLVVYIRSV